MANLFTKALKTIKFIYQKLELKRLFVTVLVGFLVLGTGLNSTMESKGNGNYVKTGMDKVFPQNDTDRPKTIGEWEEEARQTENLPVERARRIAKESGEALKLWGSVYIDTAKRSANSFKNGNN